MSRSGATWGCVALMLLGAIAADASAQARGGDWVTPRTPEGRPDLQGNWSNATITPIQRSQGQGPTLTAAQVAEIEGGREQRIEEGLKPSDPDRDAPPVGGDGSTGAAGGVGGYNYFYIDAGDRVARLGGEYRSSLITHPANGRRPGLTAEARQRFAARRAARATFGQYDNPENRPMAERCLLSFGSNAGPPMLPNYFYNNNYTIVQTPDHVMIMTEMVHDTRIIPVTDHRPLPDHVTPWFGDSRGWWEGDTLVVETKNIHPSQTLQGIPATDQLTVTERISRADETTIRYQFTVDDPSTYTESWGGEVPFKALPQQVYEYACHEGNYALFNVLSGARAQERGNREQQ